MTQPLKKCRCERKTANCDLMVTFCCAAGSSSSIHSRRDQDRRWALLDRSWPSLCGPNACFFYLSWHTMTFYKGIIARCMNTGANKTNVADLGLVRTRYLDLSILPYLAIVCASRCSNT
eukprot:scaffold34094_cov35-Tisochrysis_lutea.AAC.1